MPMKPKVPCRHPGCPELIPAGTRYCDEHRPLHPEETRSASSRGYGSRWQKFRALYLARPENMFCAECLKQGKYTRATVIDHRQPHRGDPKLFWDEANMQPLCKPCHDKKTGREDSNPTYSY